MKKKENRRSYSAQALNQGKELIEDGETRASVIKQIIRDKIETMPLARIDYVEIVDFKTFKDLDEIQGEVLAAVAVYIGKTRLIDNFIIQL